VRVEPSRGGGGKCRRGTSWARRGVRGSRRRRGRRGRPTPGRPRPEPHVRGHPGRHHGRRVAGSSSTARRASSTTSSRGPATRVSPGRNAAGRKARRPHGHRGRGAGRCCHRRDCDDRDRVGPRARPRPRGDVHRRPRARRHCHQQRHDRRGGAGGSWNRPQASVSGAPRPARASSPIWPARPRPRPRGGRESANPWSTPGHLNIVPAPTPVTPEQCFAGQPAGVDGPAPTRGGPPTTGPGAPAYCRRHRRGAAAPRRARRQPDRRVPGRPAAGTQRLRASTAQLAGQRLPPVRDRWGAISLMSARCTRSPARGAASGRSASGAWSATGGGGARPVRCS